MSNYKPQKGDRVRVVLEGKVLGTDKNGFSLGAYDGNFIIPGAEHVVSIEKIEPPVEVFKPGDVVRAKWNDGFLYSLGRDGYFSHSSALWFPYEDSITQAKDFTSRVYERVELA